MKGKQFCDFLDETKSTEMKKIGEILYPAFRLHGIVQQIVTVLFFPFFIPSALFFLLTFLFSYIGEGLDLVLPDSVGMVFAACMASALLLAGVGALTGLLKKHTAKKVRQRISELPEFCSDNGQFFQHGFVGAMAYEDCVFFAIADDGTGESVFDLHGTAVSVEMFSEKKGSWMIDYDSAARSGRIDTPYTIPVYPGTEALSGGTVVRFNCSNCKKTLYRRKTAEYAGTYLCPQCGRITKTQ